LNRPFIHVSGIRREQILFAILAGRRCVGYKGGSAASSRFSKYKSGKNIMVNQLNRRHLLRGLDGIFRQMLLFMCVVVETTAQPAPPSARLIEDWRLRAEDHNFSRIPRIYVGPRNVTVVPLRDETRLALFDSTGQRFGSVGR